jgi:hypothetical protein
MHLALLGQTPAAKGEEEEEPMSKRAPRRYRLPKSVEEELLKIMRLRDRAYDMEWKDRDLTRRRDSACAEIHFYDVVHLEYLGMIERLKREFIMPPGLRGE